jgi:hypothetical protein
MHVKYLLLGQEFGDRKYLIRLIEPVAVCLCSIVMGCRSEVWQIWLSRLSTKNVVRPAVVIVAIITNTATTTTTTTTTITTTTNTTTTCSDPNSEILGPVPEYRLLTRENGPCRLRVIAHDKSPLLS